MLACAQLGITVASLGLGAVAEPAVADLLEAPFAAARLPEGLRHPVAFALALAVVVYLHVVLGEMVPKNLAIAGPERAALMLAPPLVGVARVVKPLIVVLDAVTRLLLRLLRRGAEGGARVGVHARRRCTRSSPSRAARACSTTRSTAC